MPSIKDKLYAHYNEVIDTLSSGKPGRKARSDLNTLSNKLTNSFPMLKKDFDHRSPSSIQSIIDSVGMSGITRAYTPKELIKLGRGIKDSGARAAHTVRGVDGYAHEDFSTFNNPALMDEAISKINRHTYLSKLDKRTTKLGINDKFESKYGDEVEDLMYEYSDYADELFSKSKIDELIGPSKMKLDRPLYLTRTEGLMAKNINPSDKDIVSATAIDVNNFINKGDPNSMIYKLPKGESIYNTLNRADPNEVLATRNTLKNTKNKMRTDEYLELMKKGMAPFAIGGLMMQEETYE